MNPAGKESKRSAVALALSWAGMLAFALTLPALSKDMAVTLAGDQEVPAVTTSATGTGTISVAADKAVSGSIMVKGVNATAAHIHEAAKGKNGPVIVPLTKSGDSTFTVPAGAKTPFIPAWALGAPQTTWTSAFPVSTRQTLSRSALGWRSAEMTEATVKGSRPLARFSTPSTS